MFENYKTMKENSKILQSQMGKFIKLTKRNCSKIRKHSKKHMSKIPKQWKRKYSWNEWKLSNTWKEIGTEFPRLRRQTKAKCRGEVQYTCRNNIFTETFDRMDQLRNEFLLPFRETASKEYDQERKLNVLALYTASHGLPFKISTFDSKTAWTTHFIEFPIISEANGRLNEENT